MTTIILAPHGDDETLFAAYTCMRTRGHVIVCTQDASESVRQERSIETTRAIEILGCSHHEWPVPSGKIDPAQVRLWLKGWDHATQVYAPAIHPEGHEEHNLIGELAREVFGDRVVFYTTYAPRGQRHIGSLEIIPSTDEIQWKLQALACYRTQISYPLTRPWFFDLLDLREWHA